MGRVSVIIPSRNERFLPQTVDDVFRNATGDVEVIAVLDGYWPTPILEDRPNLKIVHFSEARGMRRAINAGVAVASGDYILKCDGHCAFSEGFDEVLQADCDDDWVVIPRRYSLDAEAWERKAKHAIDYMYLSYPNNPGDWGGAGYHGREWVQKNQDLGLRDVLIDDQMSFQGSGWFMPRRYFYYLELMDWINWGGFWQEAQEIGFKAWLSGGQVKVNKKAWYAHLHKGKKYGRGYFLNTSHLVQGTEFGKKFAEGDQWSKCIHDVAWLVDKFWPVPEWPSDRELWTEKGRQNAIARVPA